MFGWQTLTFKRYQDLGDVYYGKYKYYTRKLEFASTPLTTILILINGPFLSLSFNTTFFFRVFPFPQPPIVID